MSEIVEFANPAAVILGFVLAGVAFLAPQGVTRGLGLMLLMAGIAIGCCSFVRMSDGSETVAQHVIRYFWRGYY